MSRKIIALLLGVVILNAATELHQLAKLPVLIQHFFHHRHEDSSMSFMSFLKIHYATSNHPDDNDEQQDNELPFKSTGDLYHVDVPVIEKRIVDNHSFYVQVKSTTDHPEGVPNNRSFSIFHPPRTV